MLFTNYSCQQFEDIFDKIFDNKIVNEDVKNILLDINDCNLPINSIIGAVNSLQKRMIKIPNHHDALDVCGTGGDQLNTLNISTAVAIILASSGIKIAKHGNRAVSSKSGSADIFHYLGIKFDDNIANIDKNLRNHNLSFLFAPYFHQSLKNIADIRKSINAPTIFNYIGPLLNPTNPRQQIIGTTKFEMMQKIGAVLLKINPSIKAYIVNGFDGMDEITICDNSYLLEISNQTLHEVKIINPTDYDVEKCALNEILGKDPEYNAKKMLELFNGGDSKYLDIVTLNCAFALQLVGKINDIKEGILYSKNIIRHKTLNFLKEIST